MSISGTTQSSNKQQSGCDTHRSALYAGTAKGWPLHRLAATDPAAAGMQADARRDWWAEHVLCKNFIECRSFAMIFR